MELKKCVRCGCFFATNGDVCCNCASKDKHDIYALNNYIVNSTDIPSVDSLSYNTGVSAKNINRFIENNIIKYIFLLTVPIDIIFSLIKIKKTKSFIFLKKSIDKTTLCR